MDTRTVRTNGNSLWVGEQHGSGAPIILMHGFPDNHHLYDRLVPLLSGRRVVTFDFLGWGDSDKPVDHAYTAEAQTRELDAVINELGVDRVILVAHDASGPPVIDWALAHPDRVERLVLLNTYYPPMRGLRPPEAIWLFSTPGVRRVARWGAGLFGNWLFRRMYFWQVGRFFRDERVRDEFVPLFYEQFARSPSARPAFFGLNEDLRATLRRGAARADDMRRFDRPIRVVFGREDPYLNAKIARQFAQLFPHAELTLVDGAHHFVQLDKPEKVASEIMRD